MPDDGMSREGKEEKRKIGTEEAISRSLPDDGHDEIRCDGPCPGKRDSEEQVAQLNACRARCVATRSPQSIDSGYKEEKEVDTEPAMGGAIDEVRPRRAWIGSAYDPWPEREADKN
jgi:hypothetical protein